MLQSRTRLQGSHEPLHCVPPFSIGAVVVVVVVVVIVYRILAVHIHNPITIIVPRFIHLHALPALDPNTSAAHGGGAPGAGGGRVVPRLDPPIRNFC